MKSGDYSVSREDEYYRRQFAEIKDPDFVRRNFSSQPALVAKERVNGHRMWKEYRGGAYDSSKFDIVEGMWDHEHCSVCWFTINDGYSYWENGNRIKQLCDACHEAFVIQTSS